MAVNLTPKADATLVNQSYRMGMAGVPKDLSKTFDGMSKSYGEAMKIIGTVGNAIGQTVGKLAGEGIKQGIATIRGLNDAEKMGEWSESFKAIAEEVKQDRGIFIDDDNDPDTKKVFNPRYVPFSKKGKEARENFRKKKDELFTQMKGVQEGVIGNATALTNGSFNADATGASNITFNNLILAKGRPMEEGSLEGAKSILTKDDKGNIAFKFVNKNGDYISGVNEETGELIVADENNPVKVITNSQISGLIVPKVEAVDNGFKASFDEAVKNGGEGNPFLPNAIKKDVTNLIQTDEGFLHATHTTIPGMDQSYADMLTMPNEATEEMYKALFDIDGDGDVDADDKKAAGAEGVNFGSGYNTVENFKLFRKAMLDPNNKAARDIFANKVVEGIADGYQSGVDAAQAKEDAEMEKYATKQDLLQENRLEVKNISSSQQLVKMREQQALMTEREKIKQAGMTERKKIGVNKTLKFSTDSGTQSIQSSDVYNVVDKINQVITNPSQGQVGEVISFGTSVFKFDEDYNILFATGKDETTGLYKYDQKFVGPQRNEFFVTHLGMNKNAYGLQNFPNK